ncbi:MAG: winged helix-turn-helix domain-containing protein [Sphaerochaetaceae bacterium]|nr:winged helix-turn-helix domain-containing protein [Sphaerochaetaceae bacterium]MDC7250034.1 winged helix-turn-helix domain-containing protein [Sphaerochaetaceae bacterium]
MNLQYNEAVELVLAFFTWTSQDTVESYYMNQIPKEIIEWKDNQNKKYSNFFLEQSKLLSSEFLLLIFSLIKIINVNKINSVDEFLQYLSGLSGKSLAKYVIMGENFDYSINQLIENPKLGKEAIDKADGTVRKNEDELFVDFLNHPDFYREQLFIHLEKFYKNSVLPYQQAISKRMNILIEEEKIFALDNKKDFLETRLHYNSDYENLPETVYISYYDSLDSIHINLPSLVIYGWKNKDFNSNPNIEEIYGLITDETRRNIIKGLSKKDMFSREISDKWNLSPSTVSYHMNKLYSLGLINHRPGPRKRLYHVLNKEKLNQLMEYLKKDLMG